MNDFSVGGLKAEMFSPAKMVYAAYILAVLLGKLQTDWLGFCIISAVFLIVEVFHNDYLRILLNAKAQAKGQNQARVRSA
jgi:hypothetical protein